MADEGSKRKKSQDDSTVRASQEESSLKAHQYASNAALQSTKDFSGSQAELGEQSQAAVRPGHGLYNRRRERRERSILGILDRKLTGYQKEVLHYCIFVALFSVGWFLDRPGENAFFLSERVKQRFLSAATNVTDLRWHDATTVEQVWDWMAGPLLDVVYDEDTPGSGVGNILGVNGLLYGVRIRQVRVRGFKCSESPEWAYAQITQKDGFDGVCYPTMNSWNEDETAYGVSTEDGETVEPLFFWTEAEEWSRSTSTDYGWYGPHGFVIDMPAFNKSRAFDDLDYHRRHAWLDLQTRAVFIDAMLFNPSLRLASSVRLMAEMPEYGGVVATSDFVAVRLLRYSGVSGVLELIVDLLCIVWTLKLLFVEFLALRAMKAEYIKSFWGMMMWLKGVLIFAVVGLRVTALKDISRQHSYNQDLQAATSAYVDLHHIPHLALIDANIMAVLSVLIYARLFSYCASVPGVDHLSKVILKAMAEIVPFFLLFCVIFLGFSLAFYTLFGLRVYAYRSFTSTLSSNVLVLMGSSDYYDDMYLANPTMAPIMYYSLLVVEYVLLLNMFTAIMVHTVTVVKSELTKEPDELFKERIQQAIDHLKKKTNGSQVHIEEDASTRSFDEEDPLVVVQAKDGSRPGTGEHAKPTRESSHLPGHTTRRQSVSQGGRRASVSREGDLGRTGSAGFGRTGSAGHGHHHHHGGHGRHGHGNPGLTEVQAMELLGQVEDIRQRLVATDDLRTQVMSVSDRLNALTEYLLAEPLNRGEERFAAVSRKLDRLCEALVASNLAGAPAGLDELSASLGLSATGGAAPSATQGAARRGGSNTIPGWTD